MSNCRVCGNKITQPFSADGEEFDCLACAKQALVPTCMHCGCFLSEQAKQDQQHTYYCCEACAEGCELTTNSV